MRVQPRINEEWKKKMETAIADLKFAIIKGGPDAEDITVTTPFNKAKQWLIMRLCDNGIPFQVKNAGAGVSIITTDVEFCPMCKRPLNPKKEK